jgi:hypothetical protein
MPSRKGESIAEVQMENLECLEDPFVREHFEHWTADRWSGDALTIVRDKMLAEVEADPEHWLSAGWRALADYVNAWAVC